MIAAVFKYAHYDGCDRTGPVWLPAVILVDGVKLSFPDPETAGEIHSQNSQAARICAAINLCPTNPKKENVTASS